MTTPAPKPAKVKRRDAYIARVTISIPLGTDQPESYAEAIKAVQGLKAHLPDGSEVKIDGSLGKI